MLLNISEFSTAVVSRYVDCSKCGGAGHILSYRHVQGGVCFKCNGSGKLETKATVTVTETTQVNAWEMLEDESFEDLMARRQAKKDKTAAYLENFDLIGLFSDSELAQ